MNYIVNILNLLLFCVLIVENYAQQHSNDDVYVKMLEFSSEAVFRYAKVSIRSLIVNRRSNDQELIFQVSLPKEAFITSFVIITDERRIEAVIKEKGKAQETYNKAKEHNVTAGLVTHQSISDDLDFFKIHVNVAGHAKVNFLLEYEEFLQRRAQKYSQKIFVVSNYVIYHIKVSCSFKEKQKFKYLSYKTPNRNQHDLPGVGVFSNDSYYVKTIEWEQSRGDLAIEGTDGLKEPFEVEYELELVNNGGMAFVNNKGDFVYLFSGPCSEEKIMGKQIVFVIDISGSMQDNPIHQVRLAMSSILPQLREIDYFNIIIFNEVPTLWKSNFHRASKENTNTAKIFVREKVKAYGATNINDALLQAIDLFGTSESVERYGQVIIFLTDGKPTVGEKYNLRIRNNVRNRNHVRGQCCKTTINTIAFGWEADRDFLQQIAYENAGTLKIIKDLSISAAKSDFIHSYDNIKNPYYKNLRFDFEVDGESLAEENFTQSILPLYDCGSEIVISGSTIPGKDIFPTVKVIGAQNDITFDTVPTVMILGGGESQMLTRLSVYQKIKQLLKEADIALNDSVKKAKIKMALKLALEYGFVTPLTSLIVTDYMPSQSDGYMDYLYEDVLHSDLFNGFPTQLNSLTVTDRIPYHNDEYMNNWRKSHSEPKRGVVRSIPENAVNNCMKMFINIDLLINLYLISFLSYHF